MSEVCGEVSVNVWSECEYSKDNEWCMLNELTQTFPVCCVHVVLCGRHDLKSYCSVLYILQISK